MNVLDINLLFIILTNLFIIPQIITVTYLYDKHFICNSSEDIMKNNYIYIVTNFCLLLLHFLIIIFNINSNTVNLYFYPSYLIINLLILFCIGIIIFFLVKKNKNNYLLPDKLLFNLNIAECIFMLILVIFNFTKMSLDIRENL